MKTCLFFSQRVFKKSFFIICLALGFIYLKPFCEKQTGRFTILKISSSLPFDPRWEIPPPSKEQLEELGAACAQKFYYLGAGGQSYAFISEDQKTVLKFFKAHIPPFFPRSPSSLFPQFLQKALLKKNERMMQKLSRDFNSYKIAYEELKEETALLYVHLNKSSFLKQKVTIVDKLGIEHLIDLDSKEFALQKRVDLLYPSLEKLIKTGQLEEAKLAIDSLLNVIASRCKKGVFDEDPCIHRNSGFIGSQARLLDVGRFKKDPSRAQPKIYQKDLEHITLRLKNWLEMTCPPLVSHLETRLYELASEAEILE